MRPSAFLNPRLGGEKNDGRDLNEKNRRPQTEKREKAADNLVLDQKPAAVDLDVGPFAGVYHLVFLRADLGLDDGFPELQAYRFCGSKWVGFKHFKFLFLDDNFCAYFAIRSP